MPGWEISKPMGRCISPILGGRHPSTRAGRVAGIGGTSPWEHLPIKDAEPNPAHIIKATLGQVQPWTNGTEPTNENGHPLEGSRLMSTGTAHRLIVSVEFCKKAGGLKSWPSSSTIAVVGTTGSERRRWP